MAVLKAVTSTAASWMVLVPAEVCALWLATFLVSLSYVIVRHESGARAPMGFLGHAICAFVVAHGVVAGALELGMALLLLVAFWKFVLAAIGVGIIYIVVVLHAASAALEE